MRNYAAYLPATAASATWQVAVTAAGFTDVPPGAPYPPGRHPMDHLFTWQHGRVLSSYQAIYISSGSGTFESKSTGLCPIGPGDVFVLFPGIWHRYQPDTNKGWVESWIELQGHAVKRLESAGLISAERPIYHLDRVDAIETVLHASHRIVETRPAGYSAVLGTLGLQLLAWLQAAGAGSPDRFSSVAAAVERAQETLSNCLDRPVNIEALAEQYDISYSSLRHAFKTIVGISPKQYHLQVRLHKARDLLQNTDLPLARIADALGFASSFHLSGSFKAHMGASPAALRRRNANKLA